MSNDYTISPNYAGGWKTSSITLLLFWTSSTATRLVELRANDRRKGTQPSLQPLRRRADDNDKAVGTTL